MILVKDHFITAQWVLDRLLPLYIKTLIKNKKSKSSYFGRILVHFGVTRQNCNKIAKPKHLILMIHSYALQMNIDIVMNFRKAFFSDVPFSVVQCSAPV